MWNFAIWVTTKDAACTWFAMKKSSNSTTYIMHAISAFPFHCYSSFELSIWDLHLSMSESQLHSICQDFFFLKYLCIKYGLSVSTKKKKKVSIKRAWCIDKLSRHPIVSPPKCMSIMRWGNENVSVLLDWARKGKKKKR